VPLRLRYLVWQAGHDPRRQPFAPHQHVSTCQARHLVVGLEQPQRLDPAVTGEDVPGGRVVRFGDHRQRDPRHPLTLHLLRQRRHDRCPFRSKVTDEVHARLPPGFPLS